MEAGSRLQRMASAGVAQTVEAARKAAAQTVAEVEAALPKRPRAAMGGDWIGCYLPARTTARAGKGCRYVP